MKAITMEPKKPGAAITVAAIINSHGPTLNRVGAPP